MAENKKQINCFIDVDRSSKNFLLILDPDTNWKTFSNEIKNQLTNYDTKTKWNYSYLDEMGDKISFQSDIELKEAFHYAQSLKDSFFVIFVDTNNKHDDSQLNTNDYDDEFTNPEKYFSFSEMICEMKESVKPIERYMKENSPELIPIFDQTSKMLYGSIKRLAEFGSFPRLSSFLSFFSSTSLNTIDEFPHLSQDNNEIDQENLNITYHVHSTQNDHSEDISNNKNNINDEHSVVEITIEKNTINSLEINDNKNEDGGDDLNKVNKVKAKKKLRISDIKSPNPQKPPFPPSPHPLSRRFRACRRLNPHNSPKNTKRKKNNNNNNANSNNTNNSNNSNNSNIMGNNSPKELVGKKEKGAAKREMRRRYIGDLNQRIDRIDNEISEIKSLLNSNDDNNSTQQQGHILTNQSDPQPTSLSLSDLPPAIPSTDSPLLPDDVVLNPAEEECYHQLQLMGFSISPSLVSENKGDLFVLLDKLQ